MNLLEQIEKCKEILNYNPYHKKMLPSKAFVNSRNDLRASNILNNILNDNSKKYNPEHINEDTNMKELQNAKDWAKTYTGQSVMYEGIATYQNEAVFLSKDTLKKCMPELKGRPVIIEHTLGINPSNMEDYAVGYVTKCEYNNESGDFDCDFVIWDEDAKKLLDGGYTLSTSYIAREFANGGTFINTPYDKEVTNLSFTHLAIVKNPRYEKVSVYQNSLDTDNDEIISKMSEFKNDISNVKEVHEMDDKIEVEQGFLKALLNRVMETFNSKEEEEIKKGEEVENKEEAEDLEDAVESKGEVENKCGEKQNEAEEEAETKEVKEEEKSNSIDEVDWFEKMQEVMNSKESADDKVEKVQTREDALAKGKKIYG